MLGLFQVYEEYMVYIIHPKVQPNVVVYLLGPCHVLQRLLFGGFIDIEAGWRWVEVLLKLAHRIARRV